MIVPFFSFYSFITLSSAAALFENIEDNHPLRHLTAKTMGDYHNQVMSRVDERMREDLPSDLDSFNKIVLEEMIDFACPKGDQDCEEHAVAKLEESNRRVRLHKVMTNASTELLDLGSILPQKMDKEAKDIFISIHDTLAGLDKKGEDLDNVVENVLGQIDDIVKWVDNHESLDHATKTALLSAASVAAGSTKYWVGALEDSDNSFRRLHVRSEQYIEENTSGDFEKARVASDSQRRLRQLFGGIVGLLVTPAQVIIADFIGAVVGSVDPLIEFVFAAGVASPTPILFEAFFTSVFDSIAATGILIPAASTVVRCFLEDLLTAENCTVLELFCSETDFCK